MLLAFFYSIGMFFILIFRGQLRAVVRGLRGDKKVMRGVTLFSLFGGVMTSLGLVESYILFSVLAAVTVILIAVEAWKVKGLQQDGQSADLTHSHTPQSGR